MNYPFRRTCREVAALILAREDRALEFPERLAVRIHFLVCKACPRFEQEVQTMRAALNGWKNYRNNGDE
ncbi:zf-HC2 domain-containing protein [Thiomonas intermedia]|uniref:zf-HC2 domain-containing protein n=1 Tax=Thiomonas intermedia TaxID=926 RepID=UPI001FE36002|nr:zf-HC2 domain-containing protein [Thiomonas intermedia]